jgi:hypothetical protein
MCAALSIPNADTDSDGLCIHLEFGIGIGST